MVEAFQFLPVRGCIADASMFLTNEDLDGFKSSYFCLLRYRLIKLFVSLLKLSLPFNKKSKTLLEFYKRRLTALKLSISPEIRACNSSTCHRFI